MQVEKGSKVYLEGVRALAPYRHHIERWNRETYERANGKKKPDGQEKGS
jgi:hypothetical protein